MSSKENLSYLSTFIRSETGNVLVGKEYLFEERLRQVMDEILVKNLDELVAFLIQKPSLDIKRKIINAMMTHESFFLRENQANLFAIKYILDQQANHHKHSFSIWSSACSRGQELYSFLINLIDHKLLHQSMSFDLLGTDLSEDVVNKAKEGIYLSFEVSRGMESMKIKDHFEEVGNSFQIKRELRSNVFFKQHNLLDSFVSLGKKDIIFCRNVLIYFDAKTKSDILCRLAQQLNPQGILILGASEIVSEEIKGLSPVTGINFPAFVKKV